MATQYRVGVIGHTGRGNYGHGLDVVWKSFPECSIEAVADADATGLAAAQTRLEVDRGFADYRKMLDEVPLDIVSVCPRWIDQHRDMVVAAAERGIHVYLEKPMCRSLEEADTMVEACERNDIKLAIAFQTRYSPRLTVVRQLIEDGAIGPLLEFRGRGKEDRRGGGEDLWVLGSHVMNLMHYFGGEPQSCVAHLQQDGEDVGAKHVREGNEGLGPLAADHVQAMYLMDDRVVGFFSSRRNAGPGGTGRFGLRILGEQGAIELLTGYLPAAFLLQDPLWSPARSQQPWRPITSAGVNQPEPLKDTGLAGGNRLACRDLLAAIEEDRLPEANIYEARTSLEMISAIFESHRIGRPVSLPLKTRANPLALLKKRG
jgi:predicted dehydrogenase